MGDAHADRICRLLDLYCAVFRLDRRSLHKSPQFDRGVERTPGIVGGDARIIGTRIAVWMLESYRRMGWNEGQFLAAFPTLRAEDLRNAWSYVAAHRQEIEEAIRSSGN